MECPHCEVRGSVEVIGRAYVCSGCAKSWPADERPLGTPTTPVGDGGGPSPASDVSGVPMFDP